MPTTFTLEMALLDVGKSRREGSDVQTALSEAELLGKAVPSSIARGERGTHPWQPCDALPGDAVLKTWEIRSIRAPGGGPRQPSRRMIRKLDDGTRIIQERRGWYRARYRRCDSK